MTYKKIVGLFLGIITSSTSLLAQENDTSITRKISLDSIHHESRLDSALDKLPVPPKNIVRFGDAVLYTWTSPFRWHKKDWITAGEVVAATALLTIIDKPVNKFWQKNRSGVMDKVENAGYHYGKPYAAFIITGGFLAVGTIIKNDWAKETALILGSTYLSAGALQSVMKTAIGRARPGADVGNMHFKPFSHEPDYHSFPSGHIQIAMTTAAVLANRVNNPYLKAGFYATAGVTMLARMYANAHWTSDLFFGGAIAYFCAKTNIKRWEMTKGDYLSKENLLKRKKEKYTLSLGATSEGLGFICKIN